MTPDEEERETCGTLVQVKPGGAHFWDNERVSGLGILLNGGEIVMILDTIYHTHRPEQFRVSCYVLSSHGLGWVSAWRLER